MLNLEIESNWCFKEWKLVSFSKTIKIDFYAKKKTCKISPKPGRVLLFLVIDLVKVSIPTCLHERIDFVLHSCDLGIG